MQPWPKIRVDEVTKIGWRTLVAKTFQLPNGKEETFTTKDSMNDIACCVIALTPENRVIVAEQFRPGPELVMQDMPGGAGHADEDPKDVAVRELLEETGYVSGEIEYLGRIHKDGYTNSVRHYFLALNAVKQSEPTLDETEFINFKLISIQELFENARNAKMTDTEAVFLAYERLKAIEKGEQL